MEILTEDLECPTCAPGTRLAAAKGALGGHACGRCHGAFVPSQHAFAFRARLLASRPLAAMQVSCPWCNSWMTWRELGKAQAAACTSCGGAWLTSSALVAETMAPLATAAAAATATPGAPSPPGRRVSWSVLGIGAALLLGWLVFGRGKEPAPATRKPPASEATLAPPPPFYPSPIRKKPEEPSGLYGGRTATWWKERLVALGSRADDEGRILYDATLRRARANGLTLEGEGPALRIVEPAMPTVAGGSRP